MRSVEFQKSLALRRLGCTALVVWTFATAFAIATSTTTEARAAGPSPAAVIAAARATTLAEVGNDDRQCGAERTVERWLKDLTGWRVKAVTWSAGRCTLTNELNPIDAGGKWCAQATIVLKAPKGRDDRPAIEIYFEEPVRGQPGKAYAFRGMMLAGDGPDYARFTADFEAAWASRFPQASIRKDCQSD